MKTIGTRNTAKRVRVILAAIATTVLIAALPAAGSEHSSSIHRNDQVSGRPAAKAAGLRNGAMREHVQRKSRGQETDPAVDTGNGRDRVEILHSLGSSDLRAAVERVGGELVAEAPGLALAIVPEGRLRELESTKGINEIQPPRKMNFVGETMSSHPDTQAATGTNGGEPTTKTKASVWHTAGYKGQNVKIGIVDWFDGTSWNNAAAKGDLPAGPAGFFCKIDGVGCASTFWSMGGKHGVAVAEVVRDMAPSAQLYLATVSSVTDLRSAIDYFASKGVRIVTRSLSAFYDGAGNGTGPMADAVSYAVSKGITFFNSAGNSAKDAGGNGSYWRAKWSDPDNDGWLNFTANDESLGFTCGMLLGFRWSDWSTNRTDYDIYLYDEWGFLVGSSEGDQAAGATPIESVPDCEGTVFMQVYRYSAGNGTANDTLELMVNSGLVEYPSSAYSATQPASDSASAGALSVGAIDPWNGALIAGYSSQGPTNDNRVKPDLSAASCFTSVTYAPGCFNGTSAATPVAAGAAALVLSHWPTTTPSQMKTWLKSYAVVDRGIAGWDNVYGSGELVLPSP